MEWQQLTDERPRVMDARKCAFVRLPIMFISLSVYSTKKLYFYVGAFNQNVMDREK
jgi:hypothetical protein